MNPLKPNYSPGLRGDPVGSSFLPEDYLRQKQERRSNFIALSLFCVVMFGVTAAFFVTNRQWTSVKARQRDINSEYATEAKKIEQLKALEVQKAEMLEKAEITAALLERVPRSILLAELINRMPEQLTLTDLTLKGTRVKEAPRVAATDAKPKPRSLAGSGKGTKGKGAAKEEPAKPVPPKYDFNITIVGLAADDGFVADYHSALKQCPLLDQVELVSSAEVIIDEIARRKFRFEAVLRPTADARNIQPLKIPRDGAFGAVRAPAWTKRLGITTGNVRSEPEPEPEFEQAQGPLAVPNVPTLVEAPQSAGGATADATPKQE